MVCESMTPALLGPLRAALAVPATPRAEPPPGVPAAVLVPLFARDGALHLLYTTRSANLAQHAGQVAFPGGRHTPDADEDLLATALRETGEEIGVAPHDVDVLGALAPVHTFSSNFLITPFVARIPHPYEFRTNPHEVSDVFSIPLATLADPATIVEETWTIDGRTMPIASYRHDGRTIWGATQRITATLIDLLTAIRANQD
jgi:8-oxo-dGTP pyrophosphatase MutT (NUDIX family)